jgi:hypothetical protein
METLQSKCGSEKWKIFIARVIEKKKNQMLE